MGFWEAQELAHRDHQEAFEKKALLEITKIVVGRMAEMIEKLDRLDYIYIGVRSIENELNQIKSEIQEMKGGEK